MVTDPRTDRPLQDVVVVAAVAVIAARLAIPPAILLVLTGVVLALVPGLPPVELAPEVVLLLVLPPVIYSSAVDMSWREFRFNLRPITLLAIGCVVPRAPAMPTLSHISGPREQGRACQLVCQTDQASQFSVFCRENRLNFRGHCLDAAPTP